MALTVGVIVTFSAAVDVALTVGVIVTFSAAVGVPAAVVVAETEPLSLLVIVVAEVAYMGVTPEGDACVISVRAPGTTGSTLYKRDVGPVVIHGPPVAVNETSDHDAITPSSMALDTFAMAFTRANAAFVTGSHPAAAVP